MTLTIGQLAKAADVKVPTIRFYEEIGLLPRAARTASDRRVYDEPAVQRLAFIRHARQLGFSVEAIRALLDLSDQPDRPCDEANVLAAEQLSAVETKIAQLEVLRDELRRMVDAACHGRVSACRVIEVLSDHGHCEGHGTPRPMAVADA
ncbi:MAG: helix-turn-helix domain-containing protein [Pseudomonadota bacterium]